METKRYTRRPAREVRIGSVAIGGANPVAVQSMTNTDTADTASSVDQIGRIAAAGGAIVRLTAQGRAEAENLASIAAEVRRRGLDTALVADIHFTPELAMIAARSVDKVRINPGNFDPAKLPELLSLCREQGVALRIGVNHGSLAKRIFDRYGDTSEGMVESAMEFLRACREHDFGNVVVSMKSSNTRVMVDAYRGLVRAMEEEGMDYPLHLGVTEAGNGLEGRVKSAIGIGALLSDGIGDTVRVSLTEAPEREIPVGEAIVAYITARAADAPAPTRYDDPTAEQVALKAACDWGGALLDGRVKELRLEAPHLSAKQIREIEEIILQAARVRFTRTEYIACPSCGRTLYDIEGTLERIRARTSHLKDLRIGVMGCIVNGPGEMADADYGYVGAGPGRITLYKGREVVERNIPQEEALERLVELIRANGDWKEPGR